MAYTPNGLAERRRRDRVSPTAFDLFLLYCEYADQETGTCYPAIETLAGRLGLRLDHAKTAERELLSKGWVTLETMAAAMPQGRGANRERIVHRLHAGWQTRRERSQNFRDKPDLETTHPAPGNDPENVGQTPQLSVNFPQLSVKTSQLSVNFPQNLGDVYKEELLQRTSPVNRSTEPERETALATLETSAPPPSDSPKKVFPKNLKIAPRALRATRIPADFNLTSEMRRWAAQNAPDLNPEIVTEEFVDFWTSAVRDAAKLDWTAAWRNRLRYLQREFNEKKLEIERKAKIYEANYHRNNQPPGNKSGFSDADVAAGLTAHLKPEISISEWVSEHRHLQEQ